MIPRYASACVKRLLHVTVILIFLLSTTWTEQCKPKPTEGGGPVIIRNVGIKLCQLKCAESGQCLSIEYNGDTLTCRLLRAGISKIKTKKGYVSLAWKHPDVHTGSCSSENCGFGQRCLKTRSGKSVCVQDEKQNYPEKSPQRQVDKEQPFGNNSLHEACRKGNLTRVRQILSKGFVDINSRDGNRGKTPLMVAAQGGHCRIVSFLFSNGANKSQVDNEGKNILHWACKGGHVSMVECLLPHYSVSVTMQDRLPLLLAAFHGYIDVCEFLVCMGANVSQVDDAGENVLHWGCRGGHLGMVKYLLSLRGPDINSRGYLGKTALMTAAEHGHRDVFDFLVIMGANVSQVDDYNNNVLHFASLCGHLELVKDIISQNKVDIKARNMGGKTAAMMAKLKHKLRIYNFLVSRGCPVK